MIQRICMIFPCAISRHDGLLIESSHHSVDLFVRKSNDMAVRLYESLGYTVFRTVVDYYGGETKNSDEDAFGWFAVITLLTSRRN